MRRGDNCFKENDYGRSEVQGHVSKQPLTSKNKENTFGRVSDFKYGMGDSTALTFKGKEDSLSFKASPTEENNSRPALGEKRNYGNENRAEKPSTGGYKPGVPIPEPIVHKPKKNRCAWNKYTYGAAPKPDKGVSGGR